jgi:hypothetical protein
MVACKYFLRGLEGEKTQQKIYDSGRIDDLWREKTNCKWGNWKNVSQSKHEISMGEKI